MSEYAGIEKRRSPRIPDGIKVRISGGNIRKLVPALNISYHGALLRVPHFFDTNEIIDLAMYLPTEVNPVNIKARVVRAVTICSAWGFREFDIGVEFPNLVRDQKEKLTKTMDYLLEKIGRKKWSKRWKKEEDF